MKVILHPYKGYLNTEFHLFAEGKTQKYTIYPKDSETKESILSGLVTANAAHTFKLSQPGEFTVAFEDGSTTDILIEDGYKFGGGRLKKAFVFDNCPWVFVVMHDRTYFYNRDTEQAYIEPVSPDNIIEVSKDYVIFENCGEPEQSLFSLKEQKPILCVRNIVSFNEETLVWVEHIKEHSNDCIIKIYSLASNEVSTKINTTYYSVDENSQFLFYVDCKEVKSFPLQLNECTSPALSFTYEGEFVSFIEGQIAVSHIEDNNSILIYNLFSGEKIGTIKYEGVLSELNDIVFVDVDKQRQAVNKFNLEDAGFADCNIEGKFTKLHLYPCAWDVFYLSTITDIFKSKNRNSCETRSSMKSMNGSKGEVILKQGSGRFYSCGEAICFYNNGESYVTSKNYSGSGYCNAGHVYVGKNAVIKQDGNRYTILSRNGYWDSYTECDIDFTHFEDFDVVKDKTTGLCETLKGQNLGKWSCWNGQYEPYVSTDSCRIYKGGHILKSKKYPMYISPQLGFGLDVKEDGITLYQYSGEAIIEKLILEDIYDTSKYTDVLLSESGDEILYRTSDGASVMNVKTGDIHTYDNLSYVKHINGIRPLFSTPASLQPRVVNPVTGQIVDCDELKRLQFISPDGALYADTRLEEYVEYYSKDTGRTITGKEYNSLYNKFQYPWTEKRDSADWEKIKRNRIEFILEHFDFLNKNYPNLFHNSKEFSKWEPCVLDIKNTLGTQCFLGRIFEARGVAIIRNSHDDSEYCRIPLGAPLSFLNYVAFSYDAQYVSIAGYRGSSGGVFIVFDLINKSVITHQDTRRAVWATGFSKGGALAAYTSNPFTIFSKSSDEYEWSEDHIIRDRNYLTFSADGNLFALSNQGYISKYNRNGNVITGWGHQPSSMVSIHSSQNPFEEIIQFHDLSEEGIMNSSKRSSVASVSFSKGNKSLLMVGNDGVVIIRNLHLD